MDESKRAVPEPTVMTCLFALVPERVIDLSGFTRDGSVWSLWYKVGNEKNDRSVSLRVRK